MTRTWRFGAAVLGGILLGGPAAFAGRGGFSGSIVPPLIMTPPPATSHFGFVFRSPGGTRFFFRKGFPKQAKFFRRFPVAPFRNPRFPGPWFGNAWFGNQWYGGFPYYPDYGFASGSIQMPEPDAVAAEPPSQAAPGAGAVYAPPVASGPPQLAQTEYPGFTIFNSYCPGNIPGSARHCGPEVIVFHPQPVSPPSSPPQTGIAPRSQQ
jgi:hypothetical protein